MSKGKRKEWVIDMRFIVVADTNTKAVTLLDNFLGIPNNQVIEYSMIGKPKEKKSLIKKLIGG